MISTPVSQSQRPDSLTIRIAAGSLSEHGPESAFTNAAQVGEPELVPSYSSASLLRGVLTIRLIGDVRNVPSGAGRNRLIGSPSASPSHADQSA